MKSYVELAANIAAIEKMGTWIAMSKMFGEMSVNQGCVIAMHLFVTGEPALEYQRRNQIVSGRPDTPYDAMAAAFQERGGDIEELERTANAARVRLTYKKRSNLYELTWEDAAKEPFVYSVKGKSENDIVAMLNAGQKVPLKAKYATPRSRKTMLWARVISEGIKAIAPEVNFGQYTTEELEDFDQSAEIQSELSQGKLSPSVANVAPTAAPAAAPSDTTAIPAYVPGVGWPQATAASGVAVTTAMAPGSAMNQSPTELPATPAPTLPLEPVDVPAATFLEVQKATQAQREEVLSLLGVAAQKNLDWKDRLTSKLQTHRIAGGILGLTFDEAQSLIDKMKADDFDSWFVSAIFGHEAKTEGSHRPS
jgi:hypothetical protein